MKSLPYSVIKILLECYRRQYVIGEGKKLNCGLLATPSEVKIAMKWGVIESSFGERRRMLNWYKLTDEGTQFIDKWRSEGLSPDKFSGFDPDVTAIQIAIDRSRLSS